YKNQNSFFNFPYTCIFDFLVSSYEAYSYLTNQYIFLDMRHENASNINFTSFKEMGILWKHRHWARLIIFFSNNFTHIQPLHFTIFHLKWYDHMLVEFLTCRLCLFWFDLVLINNLILGHVHSHDSNVFNCILNIKCPLSKMFMYDHKKDKEILLLDKSKENTEHFLHNNDVPKNRIDASNLGYIVLNWPWAFVRIGM
ncbi:hypothetical protein ACJX0J_014597, partial [Zea mays]